MIGSHACVACEVSDGEEQRSVQQGTESLALARFRERAPRVSTPKSAPFPCPGREGVFFFSDTPLIFSAWIRKERSEQYERPPGGKTMACPINCR